ncbi:MAG: PhoH family protein [Pseudomonadota bacterium]
MSTRNRPSNGADDRTPGTTRLAAAGVIAGDPGDAREAGSRRQPGSGGRRLFVLDTNVLIHDPTAMYRFQEHDVHLPMVVLEELDVLKKGMSEPARNARQASRFLDRIMQGVPHSGIEDGLALPGLMPDDVSPEHEESPSSEPGRLFFQTQTFEFSLPNGLPGSTPDNAILAATLALQERHPDVPITLVSKDINLRIKASILGVHAEDYYNDRTLTDTDVLYTGSEALDEDFWDQHGENMESWQEGLKALYRIHGPRVQAWHPSQFVHGEGDLHFEAIVREREGDTAVLEQVRDFRSEHNAVWGIQARNREQNFALNLLMHDDVDMVTIVGSAGTGKTLLALAAGLAQTLDKGAYNEIIMTRVTVPLGEDIGFLPGTEEEKMEPWMGALMDNLEVLAQTEDGDGWGRQATNDLIRRRIKIRSLNFMRGRTFLNRYIIVDEAQNLTSKQMKALITRAGPGTKLVCLGNVEQIDTPYLTETTSGLTYVVNRFRSWAHAGHITLLRGERSRLAHYASDIL